MPCPDDTRTPGSYVEKVTRDKGEQMSLFSTVAHHRPMVTRRFGTLGILVLGIALAVGFGLVGVSVSQTPGVENASVRSAPVELSNVRFMELNTVALDALAPATRAAADDSFLYWNIGSLETSAPLILASTTDAQHHTFIYWNTESIEYPKPVRPLAPTGPR